MPDISVEGAKDMDEIIEAALIVRSSHYLTLVSNTSDVLYKVSSEKLIVFVYGLFKGLYYLPRVVDILYLRGICSLVKFIYKEQSLRSYECYWN